MHMPFILIGLIPVGDTSVRSNPQPTAFDGYKEEIWYIPHAILESSHFNMLGSDPNHLYPCSQETRSVVHTHVVIFRPCPHKEDQGPQ